MSKKRLLIMAAGTGGHIIPGLAIAETMRAKQWEVSWLGTTHGMENELVPPHNIEMDKIEFSGVRGKGLKHTAKGMWRLLAGFVTCFKVLGKRRPDVVLGMGGYVTVPGGVSAKLRGIPLVLANADAGLLLSNKVLMPFAQRVVFGFAGEAAQAINKVEVTGNPVRGEIVALPEPAVRYAGRTGPLKILVVGGSLGAKVLNEAVPAALAQLPEDERPEVTHQSGKQHIEQLRAAYAAAGVNAEVLAFIEDMPARYAEADLVICRAGAITVSELTAAGVASVLVPFIASTTSHQRDNAIWMAKNKAAVHLPQTELNAAHLAGLIRQLDRTACQSLAQAAYEQGRRNANEAIAQVLERMVKR
jgi:UDP-N-acetylglucosamine--N-acetylmuramyl-(pentapeptide) pyrophosphoryl-undecaprenol N-acetylglucosamine transferase